MCFVRRYGADKAIRSQVAVRSDAGDSDSAVHPYTSEWVLGK